MISRRTNATPPPKPAEAEPDAAVLRRRRQRDRRRECRARKAAGSIVCQDLVLDIEQVEGLRREGLLAEDDEENAEAVLMAVRTYLEKLRVTRDMPPENFGYDDS